MAAFTVVLAMSPDANAKDYEATVVSDPEGATVYMNGMLVAHTNPLISCWSSACLTL